MNKSDPNWIEVINELCRHYSQVEIAKMVGVDQQHISRIKCRTVNPKLNYKFGYALMKEYDKIKSEVV